MSRSLSWSAAVMATPSTSTSESSAERASAGICESASRPAPPSWAAAGPCWTPGAAADCAAPIDAAFRSMESVMVPTTRSSISVSGAMPSCTASVMSESMLGPSNVRTVPIMAHTSATATAGT